MTCKPETLERKRAERRAYARKRYEEAMAYVGASPEIFDSSINNNCMNHYPHMIEMRRRVFLRMNQRIDGQNVSRLGISQLIGCNEQTVYAALRAKPGPVLTMEDAYRIRDESFRTAGFDPMLMYEYGSFPARDHALYLMHQPQPNGARLSLSMIATVMGRPSNKSTRKGWICRCIKRHIELGVLQEAA